MRTINTTAIIAFILGVLLGAAALWVVVQYSDILKEGVPEALSPSDAPINEELFENSIITIWSASVEGILTQVNEDTIVIERPDERITLTIDEGFTSFRTQPEELPAGENTPLEEIALQDAPIGTRVQGFVLFDESRVIEGTDGVAGVITFVVGE